MSRIDLIILRNLFGLDLDVVVGSVCVPSSLGGPEELLQEVDKRLMRTGAALVLFGTIGYTIGSRKPGIEL